MITSANSTTVPAIRLDIPNNSIVVDATASVEACAAELQAGFTGETKPVSVTLIRPYQWTPGLYYVVTGMIAAQLSDLPVVVGENQYEDMYAAALAMIYPSSDPTRHEQSIKNAMEAAALCHPNATRVTAQQISDRVSDAGGKRNPAEIRGSIESLLGLVNEDAGSKDRLSTQELAERAFEYFAGETFGPDGGGLLFSQATGCFYHYRDNVWVETSSSDLAIQVTAFLQGRDDIDVNITRALVQDVIVNLQAICFLPDGNGHMPYWATKWSPLEQARPRLLQFNNGILHLGKLTGTDNGEDNIDLFEFDTTFHPGGDHRFVNTNVLPYDYDEHAVCPGWLNLLDTILAPQSCGDRRQQVLQEFMGYTLLTGASPFEAMLITVGSGRNGKSTVMRVWEAMLGANNVSHVDFSLLGNDARLLAMVGKNANFTSELTHMSKPNEAILKQIISGESLTIDRKYQAALTVAVHAKLVVACNTLPNFADTTDGVWRRLIIMPFDVVIPEAQVNPRLADQLLNELPGVLNWAATGLERLLANGRFTACDVCDARKGQHRREANTVTEFVDVCCKQGEHHAVSSADLYQVYKYYTTERNRRASGDNVFGREMLQLGFTKTKGSKVLLGGRQRIYRGICLNEEGIEWAKRAKIINLSLNKTSWENYPQAVANAYPLDFGEDEEAAPSNTAGDNDDTSDTAQ